MPPNVPVAPPFFVTVARALAQARDRVGERARSLSAGAGVALGWLGERMRRLVWSLRAVLRRTRERANDSARAARWTLARRAAERRARQRRSFERRLAREAEERAERAYAPRLRELEHALASLREEHAELREEHAELRRFADSLAAPDEPPHAASFVAEFRRAFPGDGVEAQRRGPTTVDVVHAVRAGRGAPLGVVLYRLSEERIWRGAQLRGAKRAAARHHAFVAVVVSPVLPSGQRDLVVRDGVAVVRPALVLPLARSIRRGAVAAHHETLARERAAARARRRAAVRAVVEALSARLRMAVVRVARTMASPALLSVRALAERGRRRPVTAVGGMVEGPPRADGARPIDSATMRPPIEVVTVSGRTQELEARLTGATDARDRALLLMEMAELRIAEADPGSSGTVREAADALVSQELRLAASDLLLQRIAAGPADRGAQLLLLHLERELGLQAVANDRGHLLAELLRLDGRADRAAEVEGLVPGRS